MKFRLMGPRGIMEFNENPVDRMIRCALCPWHLDINGMPKRDVEWLAVTHECSARWAGYARYTIRPERPAGRRTA